MSMLKHNLRRPSLLFLLFLLLSREKVARIARIARRSLLYRAPPRLKQWPRVWLMGRGETCLMAIGALLLLLFLLLSRGKVARVARVARAFLLSYHARKRGGSGERSPRRKTCIMATGALLL